MGASFSTRNHGVHALASGTINALAEAGKDFALHFLDYGQEPVLNTVQVGGQMVSIRTINLRFSKRPWQANHILRLLFVASLARCLRNPSLRRQNPWLNQLDNIPVHLSLAGGDSFSDLYGRLRFLYVALPQVLVILLGKPLVQMPQTFGPFGGLFTRQLARWILRRSALIYSRDREGIAVVRQMVGDKGPRIEFAFDMGLGLDPRPPGPKVLDRLAKIPEPENLVGLNVSGLLYMGGYNRRNMFNLKSDYPLLIASLIEEMAGRLGLQVLLIPHVVGAPANPESDETACNKIIEQLGPRYQGRLHHLPEPLTHHEAKYVISRCAFLAASRMHACLGAVSQGVPAMALSYSQKFAGVLKAVGVAEIADLREVDTPAVISQFKGAWNRRAQTRRELASRAPALRAAVLGFFQRHEIREIFEAKKDVSP